MAIVQDSPQAAKGFHETMRVLSRHGPRRIGELRRLGREIRALTTTPKKR